MAKEEQAAVKIEHILIPKHELVPVEKEEEILSRFNIKKRQLPQISKKDPAIQHLSPEPGRMLSIERKSETAEKTLFYRVIV